ncbi:MAG: hypothetical protein ACTTKK_08650 [Ottowia sp.]
MSKSAKKCAKKSGNVIGKQQTVTACQKPRSRAHARQRGWQMEKGSSQIALATGANSNA